MSPSILLADEHIMIARGLQIVLEQQFGYKQVVCVRSGAALVRELEKAVYSHLVLDVVLADGSALDILPAIHSRNPALSILVFSGKPAALYQRVLRQHGIYSFLSKEADEAATIRTLRRFLYNELPAVPVEYHAGERNPFTLLSAREKEILHYLLKGCGSNEIGETLHLRQNTVSTVKGRIFEKTETSNLHELIELANAYKGSY